MVVAHSLSLCVFVSVYKDLSGNSLHSFCVWVELDVFVDECISILVSFCYFNTYSCMYSPQQQRYTHSQHTVCGWARQGEQYIGIAALTHSHPHPTHSGLCVCVSQIDQTEIFPTSVHSSHVALSQYSSWHRHVTNSRQWSKSHDTIFDIETHK